MEESRIISTAVSTFWNFYFYNLLHKNKTNIIKGHENYLLKDTYRSNYELLSEY